MEITTMITSTETTTISLPLSAKAIEYAESYCFFYTGATYTTDDQTVTITHTVTGDPTQSIFWPSEN